MPIKAGGGGGGNSRTRLASGRSRLEMSRCLLVGRHLHTRMLESTYGVGGGGFLRSPV